MECWNAYLIDFCCWFVMVDESSGKIMVKSEVELELDNWVEVVGEVGNLNKNV